MNLSNEKSIGVMTVLFMKFSTLFPIYRNITSLPSRILFQRDMIWRLMLSLFVPLRQQGMQSVTYVPFFFITTYHITFTAWNRKAMNKMSICYAFRSSTRRSLSRTGATTLASVVFRMTHYWCTICKWLRCKVKRTTRRTITRPSWSTIPL